MLVKLCFLLVLMSSTVYGQSACKEKLRGSSGSFKFPNFNACPGNFRWVMRTHRKESVKFTITVLKESNATLQIQKARWVRRPGVIQQMVRLNNKSAGDIEVIVKSPYKFSKLVLLGNEGRFVVRYQVFFCEHPGPQVEARGCNDGYNQKYSECMFQCKQPQFYPRNPNYMGLNKATCRGGGRWYEDPTLKCMSLAELERYCFINNVDCPFDQGVLNSFFRIDNPLILPPTTTHAPTTPSPTILIPVEVDGPNGTTQVIFIEQPRDAAIEVQANPIFILRNKCDDYPMICAINPEMTDYTVQCGLIDRATDQLIYLCMVCRFVFQHCPSIIRPEEFLG